MLIVEFVKALLSVISFFVLFWCQVNNFESCYYLLVIIILLQYYMIHMQIAKSTTTLNLTAVNVLI